MSGKTSESRAQVEYVRLGSKLSILSGFCSSRFRVASLDYPVPKFSEVSDVMQDCWESWPRSRSKRRSLYHMPSTRSLDIM